jgi:hypothetical protein
VPTHDERLWVPWWWWAGALAVALLLAAEVHPGGGGVLAALPFAVALVVVGGLLWWLGRLRVRVADGQLFVDDARLPLAVVAAAEPLDARAKSRALGRDLDPLAFVVHRPWVAGAVLVVLDDPDDPTPYWVVSSRRPAELARAVTGRETDGRQHAIGG